MGMSVKRKKIVAERREKVRALWEKGRRDITDIAQRLGVAYNVIWNDIRVMGLYTPSRRPPGVRRARRSAVATLIKRGKGVREIAEALGVRQALVHRDRDALGLRFRVSLPKQQERKKARARATKILLDSGMTLGDIALALDVSETAVQGYFRETLHKPEPPEPPDFLREARAAADTGFCMCLDQNCSDYIAHEDAILEWTWAKVAQKRRESIRQESVPRSITFDSVA